MGDFTCLTILKVFYFQVYCHIYILLFIYKIFYNQSNTHLKFDDVHTFVCKHVYSYIFQQNIRLMNIDLKYDVTP